MTFVVSHSTTQGRHVTEDHIIKLLLAVALLRVSPTAQLALA
jgi:hypothetical protein